MTARGSLRPGRNGTSSSAIMRGNRVGERPRFWPDGSELEQKLVQRPGVPVEHRSQFHVSDGADGQALGPLRVDERGGSDAERRIVFRHVNRQAGVDDLRHSVPSPLRSSAIQPAVGRVSGRKRRAKPSSARAPTAAAGAGASGSCACSQASNRRACPSSKRFTFSMASSIALMAEMLPQRREWLQRPFEVGSIG